MHKLTFFLFTGILFSFTLQFSHAQTALRSSYRSQLSNPDILIKGQDLNITKASKPVPYSTNDIIFSEDFDDIPGNTSGGPGTYEFPSGWLLVNVDNRMPDQNVSYVNEAWERREDFAGNPSDSAAFSTSYYSPYGAADDWMISPLITLKENCTLSWNAVAYDPAYRDGYEVRISTTTQSVNGCMANPALFTIDQENTAWTARSINLALYNNQDVYIAFRNNSDDKFLLLIDDIVIHNLVNYDAAVVIKPFEYTVIAFQQNFSLSLEAEISNKAALNLTNVNLEASVYQSGVLVQTMKYPGIPFLLSGAKDTLKTTYTPADTGLIKIVYTISSDETDDNIKNNSDSVFIYVSEDEMARDDGRLVSQVGIGIGEGELGTSFTLNEPGNIKGVKFYLAKTYLEAPVFAYIRSFADGQPGDIIAVSDTFYASEDSARWIYLDMQGGLVQLNAGTYVFTLNEVDSTIQLGLSSSIYTPGTNWVYWSTIPEGKWQNIEYFGVSFQKQFMIRPVFGTPELSIDVDGDLSEPEYKTIGLKLNNNDGFGSLINISELKVYSDTVSQVLFLGIEGKLSINNSDGIGLWLNFDEVNGVDAGQPLGGLEGGHYMGQLSNGLYNADFEVDYMFSLNTGASDNVYVDAVGLSGGRNAQYLGFCKQTGEKFSGPSSPGLFGVRSLQYAFNNSGTAGKGFEIAIPFSSLGITKDFYLEAFAFIVSSNGYFSDITIPGNVITANLGYNPDFYNLSGGPWHTDSTSTPVKAEEDDVNPVEFALWQNYPNPFNPETIIKYFLTKPEKVTLKIFDVLGNEVKSLINENQSSGRHEIIFNASHLPSGVYIYKIQAGGFSSARKMILLK